MPRTGPPYSIGSDVWPGVAKLMEEMGELQQVFGKLIALDGVENYDHWDGTNLVERMTEELGDVLAAITFVVDNNEVLSRGDIQQRCVRKIDQFDKWHDA